MENLDIAILRTLIAIDEAGSFARAAKSVGRSESAISLQLKRLEQQAGSPLFVRAGRGMALTDSGKLMLAYARRMVSINDEAIAAASGKKVQGVIKIGVSPDFAETWLPPVLASFARTFPDVRVDTSVGRTPALLAQFRRRELDMAMTFATENDQADARWTRLVPMTWIGRQGFELQYEESLRLAVFDPPCMFRAAAIDALDAAGIKWSLAFTSPSLAGLWGAVAAGLGVTVRAPQGIPAQLSILTSNSGLPPLPSVGLSLFDRTSHGSTICDRLAGMLAETLDMTLEGAI